MGEDTPSKEEYREMVMKLDVALQERSPREKEVEKALNTDMPRLLRKLSEEFEGRKRPAIQELNDRLAAAGVEEKISTRTYYG
jgi:hypothetical protein